MIKDFALPGPDVPVIDETRLLAEFGGDREILAELRDLFLEHVPPLVQDILDAQTAGNTDSLEKNAHSLKGACATYGAPRFSMICKEIELWARAGDLDSIAEVMDVFQSEYDALFKAIQGEWA